MTTGDAYPKIVERTTSSSPPEIRGNWTPHCRFNILFNIIPSVLSSFTTECSTCFSPPWSMLHYLPINTISAEERGLWSSSLCYFLHTHVHILSIAPDVLRTSRPPITFVLPEGWETECHIQQTTGTINVPCTYLDRRSSPILISSLLLRKRNFMIIPYRYKFYTRNILSH
jgi:hypothetical protein